MRKFRCCSTDSYEDVNGNKTTHNQINLLNVRSSILKQVQSDLADVETAVRWKRIDPDYDEVVYPGIKSNLVAELENVKDKKELGNQKKWLDWIGKYGDDLRLKNDLSKKDKRDCLVGLIEKTGVGWIKKLMIIG